ncbi:exonuclease RecJ [Spirosomataceae bacterium TFI 002]|nr:exonuclease RecJ [Spirosomataceae bacterium TFI 002]
MISKRWTLRPFTHTKKEVESLANSLGIDNTLAELLILRGVENFEEAKHFFRPSLNDLHDPFLMKDMDVAVDRLLLAIEKKETIMIFGDYDVDGTTAVALVYGFLKIYYDKLIYYNPDRYKEGYGISTIGIDHAKESDVTLIIALDCGIKSIDKIDYAKQLGIDFIICDHHEPGSELPQAVAVLDPKRKDCPYPFKELTGNGVGFKLLTAFCDRRQIAIEKLYEWLDLVMVSIASDIVPIVGENRILAHFGLKKINENPRIGLRALKEVAGFNGEMSIESVVFTLGPRINAAGRIKHAKAAVQLMLSEDYDQAIQFAHEIQKHNLERRDFDSNITEEALAMINEDAWLANEAVSTVLFKNDWHKGVIGIVASRCIEHFYRPTVIFTQTKENFATGSARSVSGFNLYNAIESCSHLLEQYGGHAHAAGMTIPVENIAPFRQHFNEYVAQHILDEQKTPKIDIDIEVLLDELTPKFYRIMKQMGPFGPQNMQPVFLAKKVSLAAEPRILKEKHLKLEVLDENSGVTMTALGFNMKEYCYVQLMRNKYFDIAFSLEENNFRDQKTLQLFLKDVRFDA